MSRGHKARLDALRRAAAHLDEVTLDRAWEAALRGDMEIVDEIIRPYLHLNGSATTTGWRDSSSWLFGRPAFKRKTGTGSI